MNSKSLGELTAALDQMIGSQTTNESIVFRRFAEIIGLDPSTDFRGAKLNNLDFRDEDLSGFDFSGADLRGSDFRRSKLTGTSFENASIENVIGLNDLERRQSNIERPYDAKKAKADIVAGVAIDSEWRQHVKTLKLGNSGMSTINSLCDLKSLESLSIRNSIISDLEPLRLLFKLKEIFLDNSRIWNLEPLSDLTRLQTIEMRNCRRVTDISSLSELINLRRLILSNTSISSIEPLSRITGMRTLEIDYTEVTDLTPLVNMTELIRLDASGLDLEDCSHLSVNSKLRYLILSQIHHDASFLTKFHDLVNLHVGISENCKVLPRLNSKQLRHASFACSGLSSIDFISDCPLVDNLAFSDIELCDLDHLTGLTYLSTLRITNCQVKNIQKLQNLKYLKYLMIENSAVDNIAMISNLSEIRTLSVVGVPDVEAEHIAKMIKLEHLNISSTGIEDLSVLKRLPNIVSIRISQRTILTKRKDQWIENFF